MSELTLVPRGAFSLERAAGFGFGPTAGATPNWDGVLRLAFALDGGREHAGVVLRQDPDGTVHGDVQGTEDVETASAQVARVLSLDHDGRAWEDVGRRDGVIGRLQAEHRGLRPVLFHSPYEAAAWSIISARRSARQGAEVRRRLSEEHGRVFELAGQRLAAFPLPDRLLELEQFRGLEGRRLERLHAVARAALAGRLDPARLRPLEPEAAMSELQELPGIGPFYATLIAVRATGQADGLPDNEPRLLASAAYHYGLPAPPDADAFQAMAEPWRPFRTWACVLLRYAGDRAGVTVARAPAGRRRSGP